MLLILELISIEVSHLNGMAWEIEWRERKAIAQRLEQIIRKIKFYILTNFD